MLFPIEMTVDNARDFTSQRVYFTRSLNRTMAEIERYYHEHMLISGLNGSGKSTLATSFMCILNASDSEASPVSLMSSNNIYTIEQPWEFKGRILFYNDGLTEDAARLVEVSACIRGYTDETAKSHKVYYRYFIVREANSLEELNASIAVVRYCNNKDERGVYALKHFTEKIEKYGISPEKYLLYWRQGETSKLTSVKDEERFDQVAKMMGLQKEIKTLEDMIKKQSRLTADLDITSLSCERLKVVIGQLANDKRHKEVRDERLTESYMLVLSYVIPLLDYNKSQVEHLRDVARKTEVKLFQTRECINENEARMKELVGIESDLMVSRNRLDEQIQTINNQLEELAQDIVEVQLFLQDNMAEFKVIETFVKQLAGEELDGEKIIAKLREAEAVIASLRLELTDKKSTCQAKERESASLEVSLAQQKPKIQELDFEIKDAKKLLFENPRDVVVKEIEGINKEIKEQDVSIQQITEKRKELERAMYRDQISFDVNINSTEEIVNRLKMEVGEIRAGITGLSADVALWGDQLKMKEIVLHTGKYQTVEQNLDDLTHGLTELNGKILELETSIMGQKDGITGNYASLSFYTNKLINEIEEARNIILSCQTIFKEFTEQVDNKQREVSSISSVIASFPMTVDEYNDAINVLIEKRINEISHLANCIRETITLITEIERITHESYAKGKEEKGKQQEYFANIYESICQSDVNLNSEGETLRNSIAQLHGNLEHLGLDVDSKRIQIENLQHQIGTLEYGHDEYVQRIDRSRTNERNIERKIDSSERTLAVLDEKMERISSSVIDIIQSESIALQMHPSFGFQDIFEFTDSDLETAIDKEKQLAPIRNTIFVNCKKQELVPCSQHYHVPLLEYEELKKKVSLPLGLVVKTGAPSDVVKRAAHWLEIVIHRIGKNGVIHDEIGIRGFVNSHTGYFLSQVALDWHRDNINQQIQDTNFLRTELELQLVTEKTETSKLLKESEFLNQCIKSIQDNNLDILHIQNDITVKKVKVDDLNATLEVINHNRNAVLAMKNKMIPHALIFTDGRCQFSKDYLLQHAEYIEGQYADYCGLEQTINAMFAQSEKLESELKIWRSVKVSYSRYCEKVEPDMNFSIPLEQLTYENLITVIRESELSLPEMENRILDLSRQLEAVTKERESLLSYIESLAKITGELKSCQAKIQEATKTKENAEVQQKDFEENLNLITPLWNSMKELDEEFPTVTPNPTFTLDYLLYNKSMIKGSIAQYGRLCKELSSAQDFMQKTKISIEECKTTLAEKEIIALEMKLLHKEVNEANELLNQEETTLSNLQEEYKRVENKLAQLVKGKEQFVQNMSDFILEYDGVPYSVDEQLARINQFIGARRRLDQYISKITSETKAHRQLCIMLTPKEILLSKINDAENSILKELVLAEMIRERELSEQQFAALGKDQAVLNADIDRIMKHIQFEETIKAKFKEYINKNETNDWNLYDKYKKMQLALTEYDNKSKYTFKEFHALTTRSNDVNSTLVKVRDEITPLRSEIESIQKDELELEKLLTATNKELGELLVDQEPVIITEEGYQHLLIANPERELSLGDFQNALRIMYSIKLSQAIEDSYMDPYNIFKNRLCFENENIVDSREYAFGLKVVRSKINEIREVLNQSVKEESAAIYDLEMKRSEKLEMDKEQLQQEVNAWRQQVEEAYRRTEGNVTTRIRRVDIKLNRDLVKMGYYVQLSYESVLPEEQKRRGLMLRFKTASQKTFRVVNEREGLSGGEHAVVSLVMMAAILSVNEEMNKESSKSRSESGGYLLLDEWDAALDPINSYSVFEILKRLNKKIISVTPRSNSQGYIKEFGIVIKVLNMSQIAILKEEEYDDMFTELKVAEQDKINQVL